jgi:hypothetical protein
LTYPLKNDGVRQIGSSSQLLGKIKAMFQTTSQYNKHWDSNGFETLKIQLEEMSNWNSQKMFFGNEILPGLSLPKRSSHSDLRPPNFEDQLTTPKHRNIDIWTHNDPYIVY